jgi:cysteine-rich repeat protein
MAGTRFLLALLLAAALGSGCDTFDSELESLIEEQEGGAGTDGTGGTGGGTSIEGADDCNSGDPVPTRSTDDKFLFVQTTDIKNTFSDLSSCGIARSLPETDTYFGVDLVAGVRYHFHVKAAPEQNLAVYLMDGCDNRTCQGAIDDCPAGTDEHFSFVASTAGNYILGIDGISDGPTETPVEFLATRPVCGDDTKQHSEVCDDGNVSPDDGCDELCRAELGDGDPEVEPNGDHFGANVLELAGAPASISGGLGGPCDTDFFRLNVPANGTVVVTMLNEAGAACTSAEPTVLRLLNENLAQLARVESAGGACPAFDGTTTNGLAAGTYFLALRTAQSSAPFKYRVRIEVTAAP